MTTKIGFLRDEFLRIGCKPPKDPFESSLFVGWYYTEIIVSGTQEKFFDYDMLCFVLSEIPDDSGEEYFWRKVRETDFDKLARRLSRRCPLKVVG
jgi:hypothetical protein